jgi:hypothetical protein
MKTLILFLISLPTFGQGWTQLTGTAMNSVAPVACGGTNPPAYCTGITYDYHFNAHNVIDANSTAILDAKRNRLIIWGGGHAAYPGNEVYALVLPGGVMPTNYKNRTNSTPPSMVRLTDPSIFPVDGGGLDTCGGNADGAPQSVHAYQGLVYLPHSDKMFKWGGATFCGNSVTSDWYPYFLDLAADPVVWSQPTFTFTNGGVSANPPYTFCVLDPNAATDKVACWEGYSYLRKFDIAALTSTIVGLYNIQSKASLVWDPDRNTIFAFGYGDNLTPPRGAAFAINMSGSTPVETEITTSVTGCADLMHYWYPTVQWDPSLHKIVGYVPRTAAGPSGTATNEIVIFDPATYTCVSQPIAAGPAASAALTIDASQGTWGKFSYVPSLGKYAWMNNAALDAYTFALNATPTHGLGSSTLTCVDRDGDGYGTGPGCLGPDADDQDATVHLGSDLVTKWGSVLLGLNHLGYNPANIWYVSASTNSPAGNDSTGAVNDATHPFLTCCGSGHAHPVAGDAVLFRGGNYAFLAYPPNGTVGAPVIIMNYPGEAVAFTTASTGIDMGTSSYRILDGITFHGTSTGCVDAAASHNVSFRHIDASGCEWGMVASGDSTTSALSDFTIEDSIFHNQNNSGNQHGIYLASHGGVLNSNIFVRRNLLYNNGGLPGDGYTGMQVNGRTTNMIQEQNIVYSTAGVGFSWLEGITNSVNRNNLSLNNEKGLINISTYAGYEGSSQGGCGVANNETCGCSVLSQRGTICAYDQTGNIVEHNSSYMTGYREGDGVANANRPGIEVGRQSSCTGAICLSKTNGGNTFLNNLTQVNNSANGYAPMWLDDITSPFSGATTVMTNSLTYNGGLSYVFRGPTPTFTGYDLSTATSIMPSFAGSNQNADPKFVAVSPSYWATPALFNLRLQSTSPALAAGAAISVSSSYDVVGNIHPLNAPNMGAYAGFVSIAAGGSFFGGKSIGGGVRR